MKLFRFDPGVGRKIDRYHSSGLIISRIVELTDKAMINCAYLDANGVVGYHQATDSQLFLVVRGEGWVRGESPHRISIRAGQAAYWDKAEWHESGTQTGMVAVIIEGVSIDPASLMPPV